MKRFRLIAGPNGSGKTTLRKQLERDYAVNFYETLCADDIFAEVSQTHCFAPNLPVENDALVDFAMKTQYDESVRRAFLTGSIRVDNEVIAFGKDAITSYTVALVTNFLESESVRQGLSFSMESVFSHPSKIDALKVAIDCGYRTYLYYVATDEPKINCNRIANRVMLGGHDVPREKVLSRYRRSLEQVPIALQALTRAYFFDNSGETMRYLGEWCAERKSFDLAGPLAEGEPEWFAKILQSASVGETAIKRQDALSDSAARASRIAIDETFAAGHPVTVRKAGEIVRLYADGRVEKI